MEKAALLQLLNPKNWKLLGEFVADFGFSQKFQIFGGNSPFWHC